MDDITRQVADLGVQLAASAARNTATAIASRIAANRAAKSASEQVAALEQLVAELIDDKSELMRIAQAYQQELVAQQLTPGDIRYIADTVVPLLETIANGMENRREGEQFMRQIQTFKPLLSVETVNILQLLGFNFRQGIGGPLTQRLKTLIDGTGSVTSEADLQIEAHRTQRAAMELATNPAAYARFREMYPAS